MLNKTKYNGGSFLIICLLISVLFPLFPIVFGNSPIHLVPLNISLGVFLLFFACNPVKKINFLFFIWISICLIQYFLLNISMFVDVTLKDAKFTSFFSTIKPLYTLFFLYVGYCIKYEYSKFEKLFNRYFILVLFLSIIVAFYEIFLITDGSLFYSLFKREERYILDGKSTSWFGVTYYHSFYFFLFFCYFYFLSSTNKKYYFCLFLSILLVIASQSRTLVISLFFFILIVNVIGFFKNPTMLFRFLVFLFLFYFLFDIYSLELKEHFWYFFVAYDELLRIGFSEFLLSGSIGERINQISLAISNQYFIYGAGLGRENTPLESIYASYIYRYGLFWTMFIIIFYVIFGFYLVIKSCNDALMKSLGFFWILTPITMFASPMIEFPKINFLVFIITGYLIRHSNNQFFLNKKRIY